MILPSRRRWSPSRRRRSRPRIQNLCDPIHDRPGDLDPIARSVIFRLHTGSSEHQNGDQQKCLGNLIHIPCFLNFLNFRTDSIDSDHIT